MGRHKDEEGDDDEVTKFLRDRFQKAMEKKREKDSRSR